MTDTGTECKGLKAKRSKLAIGSVLLEGLAVALLYFLKPTLGFLAASAGAIAAIVSLAKIRKSKKKVRGKSFAIAAIIFASIQAVLLSYWRIDAAPVPNDYTISDIRSASPEYNRSYELLESLGDEDDKRDDAPAIGLSDEDVKNLEAITEIFKKADYSEISAGLIANSENILLIWKNAGKGRDGIDELSKFPEIADLTKPTIQFEFLFLKNLKRLVRLYRAYICLQSCQGNEEIALKELLQFDGVFRKLNLNARSLITKLVCDGCFAADIESANFIINNPKTTQDSLIRLAEYFTPPAIEQVTWQNSIKFEYLMFKYELNKISDEPKLKYSLLSLLKLNSTFRLYKNFCDGWLAIEENQPEIEELTVWPAIYPKLTVTIDSNCNLPWYYKAYNPIGSTLLGILIPALDKVIQIKTKLQIHYDLLQIVLNKRLGKEVSLKARAYSDNYIIDIEKKKIFSPGPDGESHTKDDIKLIINPEVLVPASQ